MNLRSLEHKVCICSDREVLCCGFVYFDVYTTCHDSWSCVKGWNSGLGGCVAKPRVFRAFAGPCDLEKGQVCFHEHCVIRATRTCGSFGGQWGPNSPWHHVFQPAEKEFFSLSVELFNISQQYFLLVHQLCSSFAGSFPPYFLFACCYK